MNEKQTAPEVELQTKFGKWLENFWYHYKWQTVFVAFLLIVGVVSFVQCASETPSDVTVTYAGNLMFSDSEQLGFGQVLSDVCPVDVDGNGDTSAALAIFSIFTEEQLNTLYTYTDPETGEERIDKSSMMAAKQYNTERIQTMQTYIMTGDCAVWMVSPYVYEMMFEGKVRIVEKIPLKETALYRTYNAVKNVLPSDTIVLLTYPTLGAYSSEEAFAIAEEYYHEIVGDRAHG